MPAPAKNRNAYRHGLRSSQVSDPGVNNQLRAFRRSCREELTGADGSLTLATEALLQSLVRHEAKALLAARWLRIEGDKLPIDQRLDLLNTVTNATADRDKLLTRLGIGTDGKSTPAEDFWSQLDSSPPDASEPIPASLVDSSAKAPQTGTEKPREDITPVPAPSFDPSPFPAAGEDMYQPGQPETNFPPQSGEDS